MNTFFAGFSRIIENKKSLARGIIYTYTTCFVLTAIFSIYIAKQAVVRLPEVEQKLQSIIASEYKDGLVLSLSEDGVFSKNIEEPVSLFDSLLQKSSKEEWTHWAEHTVLIDDSKKASLELFQKSKSLVFVASDAIMFQNQNKRIEVLYFRDMLEGSTAFKGATLEKADITIFVNKAFAVVDSVLGAVVVTTIIVLPLFLLLAHLLWSLFVAFCATLIARSIHPLSFRDAYIYTLYMGIPGIVIGLFTPFVFAQTIYTLAFFTLYFYTAHKQKLLQ